MIWEEIQILIPQSATTDFRPEKSSMGRDRQDIPTMTQPNTTQNETLLKWEIQTERLLV